MNDLDTNLHEARLVAGEACDGVEVFEPRLVPLGGLRAMTVHRTLPQRGRSLVGAWCFLDHYGPDDVSDTGGMQVRRHPHTGLATVSWLFSGRIDHLDSGGTAATVLPGELNLMIAGRGITHQELSSADTSVLHGVQLWYALPEARRFDENAFVHYAPEPVRVDGMTARVFIGKLLGSISPVDTRTSEMLGAELLLDPGASVEFAVQPDFEHALLAETNGVRLNGRAVEHRALGYVAPGMNALRVEAGPQGARVMLLGGIPFGEQILMWWNFVGRDHNEIVEYRRRYQAEVGFEPADPRDAGKRPLFGEFPADLPEPIPAPVMPLTKLRSRG